MRFKTYSYDINLHLLAKVGQGHICGTLYICMCSRKQSRDGFGKTRRHFKKTGSLKDVLTVCLRGKGSVLKNL